MEALNTAQHKAAEAMYKSGERGGWRRAGGGPAPAWRRGRCGEAAAGGAGDVIDAEVVEEEKK